MKVDRYGQVEITETEAFDALYSGKLSSLNGVNIDNLAVIEQYNHSQQLNADSIPVLSQLEKLDIDVKLFDEANQLDWFMPEEYNSFPIHQWLIDQCNTEQERSRVDEELLLFIQHNMFDLLFYLKYLVDTLRKNKVVWGVGRGSSVASYVLYLIGIHKIDSIKYDLDIKEFLK